MIGQREVEILLVEDNPNDAEMAIRALKKNKISNKVMHVCDGNEALEFIRSRGTDAGRPLIVLLDLKLPKMGGLEVLKEMKGDPELMMIPVIVLTSSREESDLVQSYRLGVNSYLVKPVDFNKFSESIKEIGCYWLLLNQQP